MLSSPTPFPQVGSYALLPVDPVSGLAVGADHKAATTHLARIIALAPVGGLAVGADRQATVSLPLVPGSSGTRSVALGELIDPTPLTAEERRELDELCTRCLAAASGGLDPMRNLSKRQRARFDELSSRAARAATLERLLAELKQYQLRQGMAA